LPCTRQLYYFISTLKSPFFRSFCINGYFFPLLRVSFPSEVFSDFQCECLFFLPPCFPFAKLFPSPFFFHRPLSHPSIALLFSVCNYFLFFCFLPLGYTPFPLFRDPPPSRTRLPFSLPIDSPLSDLPIPLALKSLFFFFLSLPSSSDPPPRDAPFFHSVFLFPLPEQGGIVYLARIAFSLIFGFLPFSPTQC